MSNPFENWSKEWENFENTLFEKGWKKIGLVTNTVDSFINTPIYQKEDRLIDVSGNFGGIELVTITDLEGNHLKTYNLDKFLENE